MQRRLTLTLLLILVLPLTGARAETTYHVAGLAAPAEIRVDKWGVPHIYAGTHYDAFFVQGFNAARDRLWQIDLWRRRGLGELASVLGPRYVEQDRAARLFLYRGDMFREWLAYGSDAKQIATSFTAGINAWLDLVEANPSLLPAEFSILGYRPARWRPEDVVRIRSHGLWRNVTSEAWRARIVCKYGIAADALRKRLEPPWETKVPAGLDPCEIPGDVARVYSLAKAPVDFSRAVQFAGVPRAEGAGPTVAQLAALQRDAGSNNWAVSPARTATGRAILANDPHRGHAVPSLRYIAHLVAPGLDVIGAGEPALPGISIGHNERIAFGLTIFGIDQEDLMVYERDGARYRYGDGWRNFEVLEESVPVRDGGPSPVTLEFTVHGPVIYKTADKAFAVHAAWLEPGMAPYFGSVEYMRAQNWRQFLAALNRWGAPSENQVYADVDGNIGFKPAGLTPVRTNYDGLLPVPGDGSYEWHGFYDMDRLPVEYNPSRGWVATANAVNLPADYPYRQIRPGFEWSSPWRIQRISEMLARPAPHTMQDSVDLQRDYLSIPARRIVGALDLAGLPSPADALFAGWDFRLTRDSAAAALFEIWFSRYLKPAVVATLTEADPADLGYLDPLVVIEALEAMPRSERGKVAAASLAKAIADARELMGEDPGAWHWGAIHLMKFQHPLYAFVDPALRRKLAMPVVSRGGSGDTPNATSYAGDFDVRGGASWRMVLDVGNWDHAYMTNAPGQSGVPGSPHYHDLLKTWAEDGTLPLVYSREAVLKNTESTIVLLPEGAK